jgi:oligopeptide/dipeptide ABC transporter ATP-binding protein
VPQARPLIEVQGLRVRLASAGGAVYPVDGVDLEVGEREAVALVGESGCGKSLTALALARILPAAGRCAGGTVRFRGEDLQALPERALRRLRGRALAYVFQDPAGSLNPVRRIGPQIAESMRLHGYARARRREEVAALLRQVGFSEPERLQRAYPHELSGGMQQRAMLAMALACRPNLLVADEPTTALDVTVQAQIVGLLRRLRAELQMAVLLITHNLGLVAAFAERVYVMYAGRIVEAGPAAGILRQAAHPYTRALLAAVPRVDPTGRRMEGIPGTVPEPGRMPAGCRFHPRCRHAQPACREAEPEMATVDGRHEVRCHFWKSLT